MNIQFRAKAFLQFSDLRLKTNVSDILDAVNIISQLEGKTYQWKNEALNDSIGGKKVIGLIAQQVQKVLPEVVHTDPDTGILSVSYVEIVPILIEAFKQHLVDYKNDKVEVQSQIDDIKQKLAKVESGNNHLRNTPN